MSGIVKIDTANPPVKSYPSGHVPDGYKFSDTLIGALHQTASGKRRYSFIVKKRDFDLKLPALTQAQMDALTADLGSGSVLYFVNSDRTTQYTVVCTDKVDVTPVASGTTVIYDVSFQLKQQ